LAEDYGYKAAVAKAYEGYRAEAAEIDPQLTQKLFSIALDMLSEPPLRLVERDSPGSPMHDARSGVTKFFSPNKNEMMGGTPQKSITAREDEAMSTE